MRERGVFVDHSTVHCWALKVLPVKALILRSGGRSVGASRRMEETDIKMAGQWKYLCRAVEREGASCALPIRG